MSRPSVGFIGVGRMGANMARRLRDCGYPIVAVNDQHAPAAEALAAELGCQAADSAAAVAERAEIVFTVVTDDVAMQHLFSDAPGALPQTDLTGRVFINCATLSPEAHREAAAAAARHGAGSLEACMASSITQARAGTLFLMIGGEEAVFARHRSLLEDLSQDLRYIGPAGRAAEVKALVNMVMNIHTAALAEGLGLGAALGLDLDLLRDVFAHTGANSRVLETDGEDMVAREHECYFSAAHAAKDSGIANALARAKGISTPLSEATEAQYRRLIDAGKGGLDKSAVAELTFPGRSSG